MLSVLDHSIRLPVATDFTSAWKPVHLHAKQLAFYNSKKQYNYIYAGRRSYKTEGARRRMVRRACRFHEYPDGRFFATAPTQQQAEDIHWEDIKMLVPDHMILGGRDWGVSEGKHTIKLINGAMIKVAGLDKPQRIEGKNWDGGVVSEYADCKSDVISKHIFPMTLRGGYIDIEGVPEGRNHFYTEVQEAREDIKKNGDKSDFGVYHWTTAEVLHLWLGKEKAEKELAKAKNKLDILTFRQEYEASFLSFLGLVYYAFDAERHCSREVRYNPNRPVIITFDFNVEPGTATYLQETRYRGRRTDVDKKKDITQAIGEIWIPKNSNTPVVCRKILDDFGAGFLRNHEGEVHVYGDPSGGNRSTKSQDGSDYDIIDNFLRPKFGSRLRNYVATAAPPERSSVNAVNSRLQTADGMIHFLVDDMRCPKLRDDFESVVVKEGTNGEIDKDDKLHTHLTDGVRYYMHEAHPLEVGSSGSSQTEG